MTNYEHGLKTVTDLIGLHILSFVEQAQERCGKEPRDTLNDLADEINDLIKAQRRRRRIEKQAKVLQEVEG